MLSAKAAEQLERVQSLRFYSRAPIRLERGGESFPGIGCVAQLVEQRSPKSPVGGSSPSALEVKRSQRKSREMTTIAERKKSSYFRDVKDELRKVTWTSKAELIFCTKAVIIATFVFGLTIYAVDLGIRGLIDLAGSVVRMVFG